MAQVTIDREAKALAAVYRLLLQKAVERQVRMTAKKEREQETAESIEEKRDAN
ncbi:MAG: hypothetical protein KDE56_02005 [Anaerolineales bacterium]|nr:hypothetical protein [Anaerolineales bacterium]